MPTSYPTPWGSLLAIWSEHGLVQLSWDSGGEQAQGAQELLLDQELARYFRGQPVIFTTAIDPTVFGRGYRAAVLRAVQEIPWGSVRSYQQVAAAASRPRAQRAAGTLLANTPIGILIPAHRVIRADGSLGMYGPSGVRRKQQLLALEGIHVDN